MFEKIAEDKIRRAISEGFFDNLQNSGRPLKFEDDTWVPEDLRIAYRVLRNAGCLPPEMELKKDILNLRSLIDTIDDDEERLKKMRELDYKLLSFNLMREKRGHPPMDLDSAPEYEDQINEKLTGGF